MFSLFRHMFRLARKMKRDSLKEAEYITSECKNRFRENRFLKDHAHVQKAIDYAKTRAREKRRRMSESLEESRSRTSGSGGSSST